jgi:hypothetical protein
MSYPELLTPEEKLTSAKALLGLPEIVVLCGSTAFMDEFAEVNLRLTAGEGGREPAIVLSVGCNMKTPHPLWDNPNDAQALKPRLDALHKAKIRLAARVVVVGTRVGDSTRSEIQYARSLGKPITFIHPAVALEFGGEIEITGHNPHR